MTFTDSKVATCLKMTNMADNIYVCQHVKPTQRQQYLGPTPIVKHVNDSKLSDQHKSAILANSLWKDVRKLCIAR